MTLPFLKRTKEGSVSMPVETVKRTPDDESSESYDYMESVADDLISAVHSKDSKGVVAALKAAFEIMEESPHEENNSMEGEE